jgi:hypothetical protein
VTVKMEVPAHVAAIAAKRAKIGKNGGRNQPPTRVDIGRRETGKRSRKGDRCGKKAEVSRKSRLLSNVPSLLETAASERRMRLP